MVALFCPKPELGGAFRGASWTRSYRPRSEAHLLMRYEPLILGKDAWGGDPPKGDTPGFYAGLLDEFKVWARALTPEEVKAEYESGKR
jgi:hypothetical protein